MAWWQITKIISIILAEMGVWYFSLYMQNIGSQTSSATLLAWYTLTNQCRDWFIWPMNIRWAKTKTNRRYLGINVEVGSYSLISIAHASSGNIEIHPVLNFVFLFQGVIPWTFLPTVTHPEWVESHSMYFPVKSWAMSEWRFLPHILSKFIIIICYHQQKSRS